MDYVFKSLSLCILLMSLSTITFKEFEKAVFKRIFKGKEEETKSARDLAWGVINFFGYSDMIHDGLLRAKDRDTFYELYDRGLLGTFQGEVTIDYLKGKLWRYHFWVLKKKEIIRLNYPEPKKEPEYDPGEIYNEIGEDVWVRNNQH